MTNTLTLFCAVDGESNPFSVKVGSTASVDELKDAIKIKTHEFEDIAADKLTLWKVSISDTDDEVFKLNRLPEDQKEKLNPRSEITMMFGSSPPKDTIHVIVERPQPVTPVHAPVHPSEVPDPLPGE
ncbi:hypothetical protein BGZ65_005016 [Modicella reniformis]|uniref:Crinkler effector protein N-terminal domain-containing protein n=1 Tax=Modicella reniformis TaxID=1440133 RepID=A0A9P6SLU8_9FUNG|nr:hypothetical protein BGZ65_005016 [Modicella reniformis]